MHVNCEPEKVPLERNGGKVTIISLSPVTITCN